MASVTHGRGVGKREPIRDVTGLTGQWTAAEIEAACQACGYRWRERFWTPLQTIWVFLLQVLHVGSSCRDAVAMALAGDAATGVGKLPSTHPSAYVQARRRLPLAVLRDGVRTVGQRLHDQVSPMLRWCGRRVWVVDGSSGSMPDTPDLQAAFSQPTGQAAGCGFPVAKIVAMFCWASGAVMGVAIGPWWESELPLWRGLWHLLRPGDVLLGDRFYCTFADLVGLIRRGCDGVFRLHQRRPADFRFGKRLGRYDRLVTWKKPTWHARPRGMKRREWKRLPEQLSVRLIRIHADIPGFRSRVLTVATSLLDPTAYPRERIAALYRDRWMTELRLRDIKQTLGMDVLRGKSADIVRKEIYTHLLAYNLIRALMWQAAIEHGVHLHRLSFAGTVDRLNAVTPYLRLFHGDSRARTIYRWLLQSIASDPVPERPNRIEPRAVKRRPKEYPRMTKPRAVLRKQLQSQHVRA